MSPGPPRAHHGHEQVLDDSNPADQPEGELHDQRGADGSGGFAAIGPDQCPSAAVTAGGAHTCGLRTDNTTTCWGRNSDGQADAPDGQYSARSACLLTHSDPEGATSMADMPIEPPPPANRDTSEEGATADMSAASAGNGGSGLEQPHSGGANPLAVAGFVCAICTVVLIWLVFVNLILGVLGLIFSWIGFNRAKKQGLKHRGLALAGLIVAPIALILSAVLIVAVLVYYESDDGTPAAPDATSTSDGKDEPIEADPDENESTEGESAESDAAPAAPLLEFPDGMTWNELLGAVASDRERECVADTIDDEDLPVGIFDGAALDSTTGTGSWPIWHRQIVGIQVGDNHWPHQVWRCLDADTASALYVSVRLEQIRLLAGISVSQSDTACIMQLPTDTELQRAVSDRLGSEYSFADAEDLLALLRELDETVGPKLQQCLSDAEDEPIEADPDENESTDEEGDPSVSPLFVAVGDAVYTSVDGVQWNEQPISIQSEATASYGIGRTVIVGLDGRLITSEFGSRWNEVSTEMEHLIGTNAITYGKDRFVAVGTAFAGEVVATAATSPDGISWTPADVSHLPRGLESVAYGESNFVGVGHGFATTSSDGTEWRVGSHRFLVQLFDVAYGNGTFVISGGQGSIFESRDGVTWREGRSGLSDIFFVRSVTYGNGIFVAVGDEYVVRGEFVSGEGYGPERPITMSAIITSQDGIDWNIQYTGPSQTLTDIAYGDNRFVAIGNNEGPTDQRGNSTSHNAVVLTSDNGTDWTETEVGGRSVVSEEGSFSDSSADNPSVWLSNVIYWPASDES